MYGVGDNAPHGLIDPDYVSPGYYTRRQQLLYSQRSLELGFNSSKPLIKVEQFSF